MARHTTFRFCIDPTDQQYDVLARHAGASRFAFNQCLRMVKTALTQRKSDAGVQVPWTGFDLINAFNAWKKTADAGRVFSDDAGGATEVLATGLPWRREVCQQVFEEAAVDLGKGLSAWSDSRAGKRKGRRVGFPHFKKKAVEVRRFGCATSTPRANRRRSALVTTTGLGRSHCPVSGRSACMMTPAGCGA
jgi:putative transposase